MPPLYYDGIECNDVYFNGVKTSGIYNGVQIWGGPVVPEYEGFTISANQTFSAIADPAPGISKTGFTWTINQLDGSFTAKPGSFSFTPSDCWIQYAPSAGIYQCKVDRLFWGNYSVSAAMCGNQNYGTSISANPNLKISLLSIDFALKTRLYSAAAAFTADRGTGTWMHKRLYDVPQASYNIHNYDNLTSVSGLFSGAPITGSIEPFITSMLSLKPNVITTACFRGCTAAADYSHCLTAYPNWF